MVKAICFKDVKCGDVVQLSGDGPSHTVTRAYPERVDGSGRIVLVDDGADWVTQGRPDQFIGLLHRPWQERQQKNIGTDAYLRFKIALAAHRVAVVFNIIEEGQAHWTDGEEAITRLREVIEAYELGKPFDSAQGKPSKSEE